MCGRFYVDDEMEEELRKIMQNTVYKKQKGKTGDVCPAALAMVLTGKEKHLSLEEMRWGFPQYQKKGLLINARAENVLEKRIFKDSASFCPSENTRAPSQTSGLRAAQPF